MSAPFHKKIQSDAFTMEIPIDEIGVFTVLPSEPLQMESAYPYMHNLFLNPKYSVLSGSCENSKCLLVKGVSEKMDDNLQNPVFYAGTLAKRALPQEDWEHIDTIILVNFILDDLIPGSSDGLIIYHYKNKNLQYFKDKKIHYKDVDVKMICMDLHEPASIAGLGLFEQEELDLLLDLLTKRSACLQDDHLEDYLYERGAAWLAEYMMSDHEIPFPYSRSLNILPSSIAF